MIIQVHKTIWSNPESLSGHESFSIFIACCYFIDYEGKAVKHPVTVINESSDHWRTIILNEIERHHFKMTYSLEWWLCGTLQVKICFRTFIKLSS